MITAKFTVPADNPVIFWQAYSPDESYRDGYRVLVSTTTTDVSAFTTEIFSTTGEETTLTDRAASLGAYAGQEIYVAFHNNSNDKFLLYMDNVSVKSVLANDITAVSLNYTEFTDNANPTISVNVLNSGGTAITSWNAKVSSNGMLLDSISGTANIASFATGTIALSTVIATPTYGPYALEVVFTMVNGAPDGNLTDNTATGLMHYLNGTLLPKRVVVIEEGTGTWCGWCPRGTVAMEEIAANYKDKAITIAVHNGDPMTVTEYDAYFPDETGFFTGFPAGSVDRFTFPDPGNFEAVLLTRLQDITPVNVDLVSTFDAGTGVATFNVDVNSLAALEGDYGVTVVVTEDGLTGTSGAWAQSNYYSRGGNGAMAGSIDFANSPDPVPAADMVYDHVAMAVLGTPTGQTGVIPAQMQIGTNYSTSFTYNVPSGSDASKMHAAAFVVNKNTHEILNADGEPLMGADAISEITSNVISSFPNPANDVVNFSFEKPLNGVVTITNSLGQVVFSTAVVGNTLHVNSSSLAAGLYVASFEQDNTVKTVRFAVEH
jgi:thiol-disulfide isomerase/thioredoxin